MTIPNPNKENSYSNHAEEGRYKLLLHNDDVNSFEHVVDSLIKICSYEQVQSEQIALIAHFKGHATLKKGNFNDLISLKKLLTDQGLTISIY